LTTAILEALPYLMNVLHIVHGQQNKYIRARNDFKAFAVAAVVSVEFVYTSSNATGIILYDQLFEELKTLLI
jgi:hypothetical protein